MRFSGSFTAVVLSWVLQYCNGKLSQHILEIPRVGPGVRGASREAPRPCSGGKWRVCLVTGSDTMIRCCG
jgi:hypothetical protein